MPERFWYSRLLPATLVTLAFKLQSLTIGRGCHGDTFQFKRKQKVGNCFFSWPIVIVECIFVADLPPPYPNLYGFQFSFIEA